MTSYCIPTGKRNMEVAGDVPLQTNEAYSTVTSGVPMKRNEAYESVLKPETDTSHKPPVYETVY